MAANSQSPGRMAPPPEDPAVEEVSPALPEAVSVTLWLRGSAPDPAKARQEHIATRVEALDEAGVETTIRTWPRRATDLTTDRQRAAVEAFDRYRAVAGIQGVRLEPFFECRTNPDGTRTIGFPVACLALERDGDLTGLYPCYVDGDHAAIEDGLDAMEAGGAENLR